MKQDLDYIWENWELFDVFRNIKYGDYHDESMFKQNNSSTETSVGCKNEKLLGEIKDLFILYTAESLKWDMLF